MNFVDTEVGYIQLKWPFNVPPLSVFIRLFPSQIATFSWKLFVASDYSKYVLLLSLSPQFGVKKSYQIKGMRYLSHQCREPFFNILMWVFFARIHISKGYREVKSSFQLGDQLNDLNIIRKNNFPYLCLESQNRNMKGSLWEKKIFVATCQFGFLKVFTIIFSLLSQPLRDWSSLLIYEYTNHASRHGGQRKKNT